MSPQTPYSRKKEKKPNYFMPLILAILALVLLTGYQYRDSLYAYWEPETIPGSGPDAEIPTEPDPQENEIDDHETETEPPEEPLPSPYPPEEGELLLLANGDDFLALVNKQTSLEKYEPADLVSVPEEMKYADYPYQLRSEAFDHLREMWEAAQADGIDFFVNSAYRSYDTQKRIFNNYAATHGEEKANQFSARPGQSEHQLGTTVDISIPGYALSSKLGETPTGEWLAENAYKFGFVMSYPEGSAEITGYIYEPWHYRYIGVGNAAAWKASGLVLCQFLEQQPQEWEE